MSDLGSLAGSSQPAAAGTVPPVEQAGTFGTVPASAPPSISFPEPQTEALTDMPTGMMPAAVAATAVATDASGTMPTPQMTEPTSSQTGEMPKGEMPQS